MKSRNNNSDQPLRPKGQIKSLRSLFHYLRPYKFQVFGAIVALTVASSSVLGLGYGLRFLVDNGLSKGDASLLNKAFAVLLVATVALAAASYARFYLVSWLGEKVVADIRKDVYKHLLDMHIGYFETTRTGELLSRLTTDTTLLQTVIGGSVSVAARNVLLFLGGFVLLFMTSAKLTGYLFLITPVVLLPIIILGRRARTHGREAQERVAGVSAYAEESLNAIRIIQTLTLESYEKMRFEEQVAAAIAAANARIKARALLTGMVILLVFGAIVTVLWLGGHDVLAGRLSGGALSAFVFYAVVVAGAVGAISEVISDLQRAAGAGERLSEILALIPEITSPIDDGQVLVHEAQIDFENVSFFYPARQAKASVQDFSLSVEAGKTVALVGVSGAGKTTIFQLLMRFYDPTSGRIRLNGLDVRDIPLNTLRENIGLVPQDPVIFSTSARENIRLGKLSASDGEIEAAARAASAWEFLEKLPQGLDTHLGAKGIQLSGGERQRIAIARAILRNPKILLLDEATSALDSENEHYIKLALEKLVEGRTTFVIAHRLSTIMNADQIVVMSEGQIVATGTHKELLAKNELYARLAELQFNAQS